MDGTELTILVVVLLIDVIRCLRISLLQNDGWIYEACCTLANSIDEWSLDTSKAMAIFQMTIDCDVPANLQLEEEVLVEKLISALVTKALKDEGVECRGVVCERIDVNPLE